MRGTATPLQSGPFSITVPDTAGPLSVPSDSSGSALVDDLLPWLVNVDVMMTPISNTNWNTPVVTNSMYRAAMFSGGGANSEINYDAVLSAGTWKFELIHFTNTDVGIYTVQLDGSTLGTIDGYANPGVANTRSQITGITVSDTGKKRLKLLMATKNASSSNYVGVIIHIQFKRTA